MPTPVLVLLIIVGVIVVPWALIALMGPLFRGIGWCFKGLFWLIAHIAKFIFSTIADLLRIIGALIAAIVFVPFVLVNIVIARWSAAAHFGRSLQREIGAAGAAAYRLVIGNPARLLLLSAVTEGIEQRLPEAIAQAPGADKPSKTTGTFPGYKVVGSLRAGGSGGRLFVAEPLPEKRAALGRSGVPVVDQVVIKAFSVKDGATLDQIVRESRALEAARRLHLILDHELSSERFYYVTAYVPGENLSIVTQQLHARAGDNGLRSDTLASALGYAVDLLSTLGRYHGAGLWHKDIKPDNIIVHAGRAHLVDLGLVTPLASSMTLTTHGTEYFRDPEMVRMALRGVKVHEVDGVKFDIYGVGAVLYSVVENSFPAHGGLSQISKGCPESLRWIIRRSMTDLVHRYPSAHAMLTDIEFVARASDPFAVKPADLPSMFDADSTPARHPAGVVSKEPFATIWNRIGEHQHKTFNTKRGLPLTYRVNGNVVIPDRTKWNLPRADFEKAYTRMPLRGPGDIQDVQGPSYVYAILTDPRIAGVGFEGGWAPDESDSEPAFAAMPAAYAASPMPPRPEPAPQPAASPWAPPISPTPSPAPMAGGVRPRIRVLDWWTGRYSVDGEGAPTPGRGPFVNVRFGVGENARTPNPAASRAERDMRDAAEAAAWRATPRVVSTKSAREQLASARARVARRQQLAMSRIGRHHTRFNAGPNFGVGFAVLALLLVVGVMIVRSVRSQGTTTETSNGVGDDADLMHVSIRVISPSTEWNVELIGDDEMLLVNEDEPRSEVVITDAQGVTEDHDAAPAAFLPRLLAGPFGTGQVAMLWDKSSLDQDSATKLHAIADLLEDGGATLIGYDDRKEDIDGAARVRQIIGVSGIDDPTVRSKLTEWLTINGMSSLLYVERDTPWVVFDVTGAGLTDATHHSTTLPENPSPTHPTPAEPAATTIGPES